MKKALGLLGATLLIAGPAVAADLGYRPVYKMPPPVFTWTGCYIGGFAGGASGANVDATELSSSSGQFYNGTIGVPSPPYSYRTDASAIAGGTVGCNWQPGGTQWVLGIEGEGGYLHSKGSVVDPNSVAGAGSDTVDQTKIGDWYAVVAGRLGYAVGPWFIYAKGGAAFTKVSSSIIDACSASPCGGNLINATGSSSPVSAAAGGGLEYAITDHWTVKGEYLWLGINPSFSVCGRSAGTTASPADNFCSGHTVGNGISTGKLGLNYKF
jgi:outer membrane immunogenic protein